MYELNHEKMWKRLLAAGQLGTYLLGHSGHIWIEVDPECDYSLNEMMREKGILLNNKIYGGVVEALATIDHALELIGEPKLLERYDERVQFLGDSDTPGRGRIDKVAPGRGGVC